MGFTIEDMLTLTGDRYQMSMIAGREGWSNSISWVLMVEDYTILRNFVGKELAVTTGMGFDSEEKLLSLVRILSERHAAGLLVNTGFYVDEITQPEDMQAVKVFGHRISHVDGKRGLPCTAFPVEYPDRPHRCSSCLY